MTNDPFQQWLEASIKRRPIPPPPCGHYHWRVEHVDGRNPGRALLCTDCGRVIGIKPDIRPEDVQIVERVRTVYRDRTARDRALIAFVFIAGFLGLWLGLVVGSGL